MFEGHWQGFTDYHGERIRIEWTFAAPLDGVMQGRMDLPDLAALGLPIEGRLSAGGAVLEGQSTIGAFAARVNADGQLLVTVTGPRGRTAVLAFEQSHPGFASFRVARLDTAGAHTPAYACVPPAAYDDGWRVSTMTDEGIDARALDSLLGELAQGTYGRVEALVVARHGSLVVEEYFFGVHRNYLHPIQSVTKSITSLLLGRALPRNGRLDRPVYEFFPRHGDTRWCRERYDISLWHLLTMSAAIAWDEWSVPYTDPNNSNTAMNASDDWVRFVLDRPRAGVPGVASRYTSGLSILIGAVLAEVTGTPVDAFARDTLFAGLGIRNFRWVKSASGTTHTGGGLSLTARDLARVGQLVLDDGRWNGQTLLDAAWVRACTEHQLPLAEPDPRITGYGYQWWRMHHGEVACVAGRGYGGQFVGVYPERDLVLVLNASEYGATPDMRFDVDPIFDTLVEACR